MTNNSSRSQATSRATQLLADAWQAVQDSGVPESMHVTAFTGALSIVGANNSDAPRDPRPPEPAISAPLGAQPAGNGGRDDSFFGALAHESGVSEAVLRDVLLLGDDDVVLVTAPTRNLGKSTAEQARTVIALVVAARSKGLGERVVSADVVREEVKRKGCYQENHYRAKSLSALKGVVEGQNAKELVMNSKWVGEFASAVALAGGTADSPT